MAGTNCDGRVDLGACAAAGILKLEDLRLSQKLRGIMLEHVLKALPEEACGLLGGCGEFVEAVLPVTNQMHSPVRFFMEPVELLESFQWLDKNRLALLAIYHSHPKGPDQPSATDLELLWYPGCAQLIWFPVLDRWDVKGFFIRKNYTEEINLIFEPDS